MSRVVKIKGQLNIENIELADQAIQSFNYKNIEIKNNQFLFDGYDHYDGINKNKEITNIENKYKALLNEYYLKLAKEKLNAELARLEEIKRIEQEKIRIEEEKRMAREKKKALIIENAKKQGYRVKKEITKDNKIKLVLQKRIY